LDDRPRFDPDVAATGGCHVAADVRSLDTIVVPCAPDVAACGDRPAHGGVFDRRDSPVGVDSPGDGRVGDANVATVGRGHATADVGPLDTGVVGRGPDVAHRRHRPADHGVFHRRNRAIGVDIARDGAFGGDPDVAAISRCHVAADVGVSDTGTVATSTSDVPRRVHRSAHLGAIDPGNRHARIDSATDRAVLDVERPVGAVLGEVADDDRIREFADSTGGHVARNRRVGQFEGAAGVDIADDRSPVGQRDAARYRRHAVAVRLADPRRATEVEAPRIVRHRLDIVRFQAGTEHLVGSEVDPRDIVEFVSDRRPGGRKADIALVRKRVVVENKAVTDRRRRLGGDRCLDRSLERTGE
jgi:hypothetical protein